MPCEPRQSRYRPSVSPSVPSSPDRGASADPLDLDSGFFHWAFMADIDVDQHDTSLIGRGFHAKGPLLSSPAGRSSRQGKVAIADRLGLKLGQGVGVDRDYSPQSSTSSGRRSRNGGISLGNYLAPATRPL